MRLIPLGINGYFPSYGRQTMSFLVSDGERTLLLDAGTGISRLIEPELRGLLAGCSELDILLSHYHLDHVAGLSYLPGIWTGGRIRLYGPAPPLVDAWPAEALDRFLRPPLFPSDYRSFPGPVEVIPVREESLRIAGLEVHVWPQEHSGGSIGIRIGKEIAYVTDTVVKPENAGRVRGVNTLVHELWFTDEEVREQGPRGHSHVSGVAELARLAGVGRLLAVHHQPQRTGEEIGAMCQAVGRLAGVPAPVPREGEVF